MNDINKIKSNQRKGQITRILTNQISSLAPLFIAFGVYSFLCQTWFLKGSVLEK